MPGPAWNDLWFTTDGDFMIGGDGDIRTLEDSGNGDVRVALRSYISHRLMTQSSDWRFYPETAGNLNSFIGKTVSSDLLAAIERAVLHALTIDGFISRDILRIKVLQLAPDMVAIVVGITSLGNKPLSTMTLGLQTGQFTQG